MRFFNIDQHIAVIADLRKIFNDFGHTITSVCMSGHASLIGRKQEFIPMLQEDKWCHVCQQSLWDEFYKVYNHDLRNCDGFICCYPPVFARLYEKFGKPIIVQIPIRYEHGVDNKAELWEEWNNYLRKGIDNGWIYLCANNKLDKYYTEAFVNRTVKHIPSYCDYTGASYNPIIGNFIYYASMRLTDESGRIIKKHDALQAGHSWQSVADYAGVIHFPYQVSTMSTFEQYTSAIPLFFPTKRFLLELYEKDCQVLDQISLTRQSFRCGTPEGISHTMTHDLNNWKDIENVKYWLQYADFYDATWMPHITYFDSFDELAQIVHTISHKELLDISRQMNFVNIKRKSEIYHLWCEVLEKI